MNLSNIAGTLWWLLLASLATAEQYIISIDPNETVDAVISAIETAFNIELDILDTFNLPFMVMITVDLPPATADAIGNLVENIPGFRFIEEDSVQTLPEPSSNISSVVDSISSADTVPYGIPLVQADQVTDATSTITICVLDTGIDTDHVDLPIANIQARDYTPSGTVEDRNGHGTHVSGTIAAVGNGLGVVGVAPAGNINLISAKVLRHDPASGSAFGQASWQVNAINDCALLGANIVSMSLGGPFNEARREVIEYHYQNSNMLFVAAAGNSGNSAKSWPAYDDNVISVAAVNRFRRVAGFSTYNDQVELAGPGVDVTSTWLQDGYNTISGTSMATPHVAAVAALVWALYPSKTNLEIRGALQLSAQDLGVGGRDVDYGFGLVQAKAAEELLASGVPTPPADPPTEPENPVCATSPPGWTDRVGNDCSWYTNAARCFIGLFRGNDGVNAYDACCSCGGGQALACVDTPADWVDIAGDGCDWYETDDYCELYGNGFENDGLTASEVCCACQGTISTTASAERSTNDIAVIKPNFATSAPTTSPTAIITGAPTSEPTATPDSGAPTLFVSIGLLAVFASIVIM